MRVVPLPDLGLAWRAWSSRERSSVKKIFSSAVMAVVMGCAVSGMAGEKIEATASPVSLFWDQDHQAFCCELRSVPEGRGFLVCDDATSKAVMEELFLLGKKGADCTVTGEVMGRSGEFERLVVSRVLALQKMPK